ncbi:MAG: hypothetical protein Q9M40_05755 [Sulfurimonas sp.]|nr:hypothetical protein [Sulfurimonas sp.]
MKKKCKMQTTFLSLSVAMLLGMTGCGSDSSSTPPPVNSDTTLIGVGVDGYLSQATVCLDLSNDGYCQIGVEPASYTDANGTFSLTLTAAQKTEYPDYQDAPLLIYSGFDVDTGADFTGKLKALLS